MEDVRVWDGGDVRIEDVRVEDGGCEGVRMEE